MVSAEKDHLSTSDREYLRKTLDALDPQEWRGLSPSSLMEKAIDAALNHDVEATLKEAVRLRNEDNIRTTPQVILVRAANHPKAKGTGLIRKYAPQITKRGDEPAVCIAYHLNSVRGGDKSKKIPNSLKRALADVLANFNEYSLSKYRMENRAVKTVDVVRLVRPNSGKRKFTGALGKLIKGTLTSTGKTWESIISEKGSTKEAWKEALEVMGHMALLRNIRNLLDKGVPHDLFTAKLKEGAEKGKQLPFRYLSAYEANKGAPGPVLDAIEESLMLSLKNLPHFKGKTMSLCDYSGSAQHTTTSSMGTMRVCDIGGMTGVLTGMVSDEGYVGVFGDRLETVPIRAKSSVFDQFKKVQQAGVHIGKSTENGIWLFWDKAIRENEHWDNVFVYSDMQAGHGGLYGTDHSYNGFIWRGRGTYIDVPKMISAYRAKVNPNVKVFLVQIAGYQDTIIPEFYKDTYILGGWGDGILRFAAEMSGLSQQKQ